MTDYSSKEYLSLVDKYWRAANYVSVGQLYLKDNPLLRRELKASDVKVHPIGHWGTIAGQNFIYAHLNRAINKYGLKMFYIEGPGMVGKLWFPTHIWMEAILKLILKSQKILRVCKSSSSNSHSQVVLHLMLLLRHQDQCMKVEN